MRTKKVNRYYCDFCGKGGCSAPHMAKHERHCTMNPKRKCGMCEVLEADYMSIETHVANKQAELQPCHCLQV